ncbi:response regulator transcription factor [Desulfogranum japonicum]|uniref:response regulator transcription factor n=1 Tax=Desulfogranum japonicum TaxID=231447 RepID=UPI0004229B13|nr:response regulator transcription factor [Desulfogranum japonicum]
MSPENEDCRSITFFTDNRQGCGELINALALEEFSVHLEEKPKNFDQIHGDKMDMLIIDSSKISLEELSVYPRIRSVFDGLLVTLIDDIDDMLQVLLYEQGVDDLLVKPVNPFLMLARIRALFRRNEHRITPSMLRFNGLEINGGARTANYQDEHLNFTSREFDLLWYLVRNACTTLDRDQLYKAVFGIEYNGYDRSIDMYIARIRAKLAPHPAVAQIIKTVRGKGYLFAAEQ